MKARESGMPEEDTWESFFDPATTLTKLRLTQDTGDVLDIGCGYGTFSITAAKVIQGVVHGFDIDPAMIADCQERAAGEGIQNIVLHTRDVFADGTGLPAGSVDYLMLFNLLHAEDPHFLLAESRRVLIPGGKIAIMHWVSDRPTPRGPSMEIRPSPQTCARWLEEAGFRVLDKYVDLPPHHFGIVAETPLG